MTSGDVLGLVGDALVLCGLALSYVIYLRERSAARNRDIDSVLAMLEAVLHGMRPWGDLFFENGYDEQSARARAGLDFDHIMKASYAQVYPVPAQPLTALIEQPGGFGLVRSGAIEAANIALYMIGVFNQYVQYQTEFNTRHLAEVKDPSLPVARRVVLAESARALSTMLHWHGIGDAGWYRKLKCELEKNIEELRNRRESNQWWRST